MAGLNLLLIEDDEADARSFQESLRGRGHQVAHSSTPDAVEPARLAMFDVVILDRRLPGGDGITQLREWRAAGLDVPVMIVSAMATVSARIEGLEAGADDYLAKPCDPGELEARLRTIMRRSGKVPHERETLLVCGSIRIDRIRRETFREGRRILLQPREQRLLEELALRPGEIVSRQALLRGVWNLTFDPRTKLIETHISRLREKLNVGFADDAIETVRGLGYRLRSEV